MKQESGHRTSNEETKIAELFRIKTEDSDKFNEEFREWVADKLFNFITIDLRKDYEGRKDFESKWRMLPGKVSRGEKIESDRFIADFFVKLGQDARLTPEEIEEWKEEIFEKPEHPEWYKSSEF